MVLPQPFTTASPIIASYNWVDFAEGTGIIKFKGFRNNVSGSLAYGLTTSDVYSGGSPGEGIETKSAELSNADYAKVLDLDFDLSVFNSSRTIRGTAIVSVPLGVYSTDADQARGFIIARIKKGDVELVSATSGDLPGVSGTNTYIHTLLLTIPLTHFKKGETLRLTIEGWGRKFAEDVGNFIIIGHDPMNRDGTYIKPTVETSATTKLEFHCPFDIKDA